MTQDHFADAFRMTQDIIIPEAQHPEAAASKPGIPGSIHCCAGVLPAIDLDDQVCLDTGEVNDIRPNRQLASKSVPNELAAPQSSPKTGLGIRHRRP
jgi:hypothetical protein